MKTIAVWSDAPDAAGRITEQCRMSGEDVQAWRAATADDLVRLLRARRVDYILFDKHPAAASCAKLFYAVKNASPGTKMVLTGVTNMSSLQGIPLETVDGIFHPSFTDGSDFLSSLIQALISSENARTSSVRVPRQATGQEQKALSDREAQILELMSNGSTNGEISRVLSISEDTVKTHAKRMYKKLGVSDRAHAVAEAFRLGLTV
ncbi:helix-turn-helix transcriptional regulator [Salininema proteolyticum]|uniref:LuxR C-terminal-related transcriptional regulator n=1 Tax=Salininema proteolyticum TaxID=1607685 RepID=A0ABV8TWG9_9ACTN